MTTKAGELDFPQLEAYAWPFHSPALRPPPSALGMSVAHRPSLPAHRPAPPRYVLGTA